MAEEQVIDPIIESSDELEQGVVDEITIDYIDVEVPEDIEIKIDKAFPSYSADGDGYYAPLDHTHDIEEVEALSNALHNIATSKSIHSSSGGFAEFHKWKNGGIYKTEKYQSADDSEVSYNSTGGVGFFVSLVTETGSTSGGNLCIDICKKHNNDNTIEVTDVYGVTVDKSGFYGNQSGSYDFLDSNSSNRANNPDYAKVCLLGNVQVRISQEEYDDVKVGDYVLPNSLGYASVRPDKDEDKYTSGFKVISKGQKESMGSAATAWRYVGIALVPQNDNVTRVMAELEKTKGSLNNVNIQLGEISGTIDDIYDINIGISDKFDNIQDIVDEGKIQVEEQLKISQEVVDNAQEIVNQAEQKMEDMISQYSDAVNNANDARTQVDNVLADVKSLQDNMNILVQWPEGVDSSQAKGVAGFVAQAEKNRTQLASLTQAFGENGTDLTAIIQKIDEHGAAIQHLVTHVDKYILGEQSPAYGLTLEQTSFIQPGTIYVPTIDHTETYKYGDDTEILVEFMSQVIDEQGESLGYGISYIWKATENKPYGYMWEYYKDVYFSRPIEPVDGDLWYCWQGEYSGDKLIHDPQTLYVWKNDVWVAVASVDSNNATSIGSVNQTAKNFQIIYTDLKDNMSLIEQDVDEIRTLVNNGDNGTMSTIHQTAEKIMMGVYDEDDGDSTSLGLLLDGMTSTSTNVNIVKVREVLEAPPSGYKYEDAPIWNGSEFVSVGELSANGKYYFDPKDTKPFTYYCEAAGDKYYVYGINNTAMANLSTRVTNTESEVESWTRFQKGQNETATSIGQTSDEAGAAISSMVYGDFRECVATTEGDRGDFAAELYLKQPLWQGTTEKNFVFDGEPVDIESLNNGDSVYCLSKTKGDIYYKLYYRADNYDGELEVVEFEKYQMKSSPYAAIVQRVENGESVIGLVAGDNDEMGSVVVNTINNKSNVLIDADKIGINGTAIFTESKQEGYTVISGDYIGTGILRSNNYEEPLSDSIYAQNGTLFNLYNGTINTKSLNLDVNGNLSIIGQITATSGYIGNEDYGFTIAHKEANSETDMSCYYLGHNQSSLLGDLTRTNPGVYIAPDGIGLGNGAFAIYNNGSLHTVGKIAMHGYFEDEDGDKYLDKIFELDPDTKTLKLKGNISLSGTITWGWMDDMEAEIEDTQNDVLSLANGEYTKAGKTFISGKNVYSPNIYGGQFVTIDSAYEPRIVIDEDGITSYNSSSQKHGFVSHPNDSMTYDDGMSLYSQGQRLFSVARNANDVKMTFYNAYGGWHEGGSITSSASNGRMTFGAGTWQFSGGSTVKFDNVTVTGLKITFG